MELATEVRAPEAMLSDPLATLATTGGSEPMTGGTACEMAIVVGFGTPTVAGARDDGRDIPVATDGSPRAPGLDTVRPIPLEAMGRTVEVEGTAAAPAALGNMDERARPTSTPPKHAAIRVATRSGRYRPAGAEGRSGTMPRAPLDLTNRAVPATAGGKPSEGSSAVQADAREPASGRWPSGKARTMLSWTKEATSRPSSVKMSARP
jgi:hypothetical protein